MIKVSTIVKPKGFMKRIPDPEEDIMPLTMERAERGEFDDFEIFVATKKKKTVGWAILFWEKNRKMPWFQIWTSPSYRKRGVGTHLFKEAAKFTDKMGVYIFTEANESFFRKMAKEYGVHVININER
jgi:GNAT superfamily N-acetyltransferase